MTTPNPALGTEEKQAVRDFWNQASCGEDLYLGALDIAGFDAHMLKRYELEPYIADFAKFSSSRGKHVLEIGVGLGADHQQFAQAGAHPAHQLRPLPRPRPRRGIAGPAAAGHAELLRLGGRPGL